MNTQVNRIKEIHRTLLELEKPMPPDDFILTYKDFLRHGDLLPYYAFNTRVFRALIDMTHRHWDGSMKISRFKLVWRMRLYGFRTDETDFKHSPEVIALLFELFRKSITCTAMVSRKQAEEIQEQCSRMLKGLELSEEAVEWLCVNAHRSKFILNRLLRYPVRSKRLSQWARDNEANDAFRHRRAEITAWILDENPAYSVDEYTITHDFDFLNMIDVEMIKTYRLLQSGDVITFQRRLNPTDDEIWESNDDVHLSQLEHKKDEYIKNYYTKRFYRVPMIRVDFQPGSVPDINSMRAEFYYKTAMMQKITMVWAISYSHLPDDVKCELLKPLLCADTFFSVMNQVRKMKLTPFLKWMLTKEEEIRAYKPDRWNGESF